MLIEKSIYLLFSNISNHFSLQIEFKRFVQHHSAAEIGTSRASINRTGKTNAAKGPHKGYNEYKDFHNCEVEAHICAAFMEMQGMRTVNGKQCFNSVFI
jgi:hypothetical protein